MVINLNPATATDYNGLANGSGDGGNVNGGSAAAVTQSASANGGTGTGTGSETVTGTGTGTATPTGTGSVNLNGNAYGVGNAGGGSNVHVNGNGTGAGIGDLSIMMGIITHAIYNGIMYLHVIVAGEESSKWITLDEAMAFCPNGVVAYTNLMISQVYNVPMEQLFD